MFYTVTTCNNNGYHAYLNFLTEETSKDYFREQCELFTTYEPQYTTIVEFSTDGVVMARKTFKGQMVNICLTREGWEIVRLALLSSKEASAKNEVMVDEIADFIREKTK